MTGLLGLAGLLIVLLGLMVAGAWWLTWLAARLDRAHARAERAWVVLDAALVRRAQRAAELAQHPEVDPASSLLVCDAAAEALEADLAPEAREQAESGLSHLLRVVPLPGLDLEQDRVALARRLHNDAVSTACALRRRPVVRTLRMAGWAGEPRPFEMADERLVWSDGAER
ncbi:MAG TPA: hypothetical protein VEQ66_17045 [Propionibacteriaceae bacterium]|nr:hypothetical protein [Propionibacteriaceae bacterium]